ncbi:unnamed protein product [Scytosiphon promiscuus]
MKWMHPNPRKRHGMESARFFIYLTVPVVVITICSDPKNMNMLLRGFNFVEYPPESKKLPSGNDIVKMMEEREAKRRETAARSGIEAHLAAATATRRTLSSRSTAGTTLDATAGAAAPPSKSPSSEGGQQGGPPSGEAGHNSGWFARWR